MPTKDPALNRLAAFLLLLGIVGCNTNSSQNKFLLAERLHEDKKYDAAINEYQEVVNKEPFTELGMRAQLKIAETQHLYLGRMKDAEHSYQTYLRRLKNEGQRRDIVKVLAKLSFDDFANYSEAIRYNQELLQGTKDFEEAEQLLYTIGRAYFLQHKYPEAIGIFEELIWKYPQGKLLAKAELEIADALSANGKCKEAIPRYEKLRLKADPKYSPLAAFGQASCYEESDDLDHAFTLLDEIRKTYPSPQVVELKMNKIKRRKILRKR